ncbi:MAG: Fic family protein [Elusimicrobiota bacterium]
MKLFIPGRFIRHPTGYKAFLPHPLPPKLEWPDSLVRSLSDADRLLGQLAGEGARLPNPHLLIRPFVKREAVYSSRIEGTQATLGELLASEAGTVVERSPHDLREVGNYVVALEYGIKRLNKLPLSLRLVRELHEILMKGVHGQHATPGEFRRSQNWIGPAGCTLINATFVPPPPEELMVCLGEWEKFLHDHSLPPLVQVALMHYQFESIHPFLDGNGRVGRLLISLFLSERKILPAPFLYLSAFFEATRRDYYRHLFEVSTKGDWNSWLLYFLNGIARQSEDSLRRAQKINTLISEYKKTALSQNQEKIINSIEMLAVNPYLTVKSLAKYLNAAFTTAQRTIDKLEKMKIVALVDGKKRNRVYCATEILRVLEMPFTPQQE